jgi:hypothetical protein
MPNWCYNNVKISFDSDNESELRDKVSDDKELFGQFFPIPEEEKENWYDWNITNWGTKWDATPNNVNWENDCVTFNIDTAWGPPTRFYEKMEELGYWVEAYYLEEGMAFCGQYMDGNDDFYEFGNMSADEMEAELPEWVESEFNLITQQRDREDEEDGEDSVYAPGQYTEDEKTDWINAKNKPVHEGLYEVKTKEWPFPHAMDWTKDGWMMHGLDLPTTNKVTDWRGLKESQSVTDSDKELDFILKQNFIG